MRVRARGVALCGCMMMLALASSAGCKRNAKPDAPISLPGPLDAVSSEVRGLLTSERALLVARLDPAGYKAAHHPLRKKLAGFDSFAPTLAAFMKSDDVWQGFEALGLGLDLSAIARDAPAYAIMGLGAGTDFEVCVEVALPCPDAALVQADTLSLLLPSSDHAALTASFERALPAHTMTTRSVGERYLQIDINPKWVEGEEHAPIRYEEAVSRAPTPALVDALAAPGAFSLWLSARAVVHLGVATSWNEMESALVSATPEMRQRLSLAGMGYISVFPLLQRPEWQEYHDLAITLREHDKFAHLDLSMSRTALGAAIAKEAKHPISTRTLDVVKPIIEVDIQHDFKAAFEITPERDESELLEWLRDSGAMGWILSLYQPTSVLEAYSDFIFENTGPIWLKGARFRLAADKSSKFIPIKFALATALLDDKDTNWLRMLERAGVKVMEYPDASSNHEATAIFGEFPKDPVEAPDLIARDRIMFDLTQLPVLGRSPAFGGDPMMQAIFELLATMERLELISASSDSALRWRLSLVQFVEPAPLWSPKALTVASGSCSPADQQAMYDLYQALGKGTPDFRARALSLAGEQLRTYDAALAKCQRADPDGRRAYDLHRHGLKLMATASSQEATGFEAAREAACKAGMTTVCSKDQAAKIYDMFTLDEPEQREAPAPME